MPTSASQRLELDDRFAREFPELGVRWRPSEAPEPRLLVLNRGLASELGLDSEMLSDPDTVAQLAGAAEITPAPLAMAYAGHQFGVWVPRLGDGRAMLLGEQTSRSGVRTDIHLKGSGRTPFARGGDGMAALGPMLREYLISEAMHALGIPTTRSLAVIVTGEQVWRESGSLPGAVLVRTAASHLRVGTFQYAAARGDGDLVRRLADEAIERHHPAAAAAEDRYLELLAAVSEAQASLVAKWMLVGFVHGVMNTDNTTISGETIDYGPCAFIDGFDPQAVFSSIDHGGRYAYGAQPQLIQWNLARLAETLVPLIGDGGEQAVADATAVLHRFPQHFAECWREGMRAKLGLAAAAEADEDLFTGLLELMRAEQTDYTGMMRSLAQTLRGDGSASRSRVLDTARWDEWSAGWLQRIDSEDRGRERCAEQIERSSPVYIPRNHLVEAALEDATAGDMTAFERLLGVVTAPFSERAGAELYSEPGPEGDQYVTYCGT